MTFLSAHAAENDDLRIPEDQMTAPQHQHVASTLFLDEKIVDQAFKGRLDLMRERGLHSTQSCFLNHVCADLDNMWCNRLYEYLTIIGMHVDFDLQNLLTNDSVEAFIQRILSDNFIVALFSPQYKINYEGGTWIVREVDYIKQKYPETDNPAHKDLIPLLIAGKAEDSIPKTLFNYRDRLYLKAFTDGEQNISLGEFYTCVLRMLREVIFLGKIQENPSLLVYFNEITGEFYSLWSEYLSGMQRRNARFKTRISENTINYASADPDQFIESFPLASYESYHTLIHLNLLNSRNKSKAAQLGKVILVGEPGVGKSRLTSHYLQRAILHGAYDHVGWIRCSDFTSDNLFNKRLIVEDYRKIIKIIDPNSTRNDNEIVHFIKEELHQRSQNWLLVYDNALHSPLFDGLMPQRGGDIIITARTWNGAGAIIPIQSFQEEESTKHLIALKKGQAKGYRPEYYAQQIAIALCNLPLALSQASAYMDENHLSFERYYADFLESSIYTHLPTSENIVTKTWEASVKQIAENPKALTLLNAFYYLEPDRIPLSVFKTFIGGSQRTFLDVISMLERYKLINISGCDDSLEASIHRLYQHVGKNTDQSTLDDRERLFDDIMKSWRMYVEDLQLKFIDDKLNARERRNGGATRTTLSLLREQIDTLEKQGIALGFKQFLPSTLGKRIEFKRLIDLTKFNVLMAILKPASKESREGTELPRIIQQELRINSKKFESLRTLIQEAINNIDEKNWDEQFEIYRAFNEIADDEKREATSTLMGVVINELPISFSGEKIADLVRGISFLHDTDCVDICESANQLMKDTRLYQPSLALQVAASHYPQTDKERILKALAVLPRYHDTYTFYDYRGIINGMQPIADKLLQSHVDQIMSFLDGHMEKRTARNIVPLLLMASTLDESVWNDAIEKSSEIITNLNGSAIASTLRAVIDVPNEVWPTVNSSVQRELELHQDRIKNAEDIALLIHSKHMAAYVPAEFISTLPIEKIDTIDQQVLLDQLSTIAKDNLYMFIIGLQMAEIVRAKREGWRIELAKCIVREISQAHLTLVKEKCRNVPGMEPILQIVNAIESIPLKQLDTVEFHARPLIKDMARVGETALILTFMHAHLNDDIEKIKRWGEHYREIDTGLTSILDVIAKNKEVDFKNLREKTGFLIRPDMDGIMIAHILKTGNNYALLERARLFVRPEMNKEGILNILKCIEDEYALSMRDLSGLYF